MHNVSLQEKRRKRRSDNEIRESHLSPFRKPLTQLTNRPLCTDGAKHVSLILYIGVNYGTRFVRKCFNG